MKKTIALLLCTFAFQISFSQEDAFKNDVVKYLEISGQKQTFKMLTQDIVKSIPEPKQAEFTVELNKSIDDLISKMADKYKEEFTHSEIKEMLKFYESKTGKKLADKTTILYEKGQAVGQEWGMNLQEVVMKYVKQDE